MPSFLLYLLLPVPVALMAAGIALEGNRGLPRLRRRSRTRTAVPGGTRRDFFGDGVGTDVVATPVASSPERPQPAIAAPAAASPVPAPVAPEPVMGPRAVPDPAPQGAERAA